MIRKFYPVLFLLLLLSACSKQDFQFSEDLVKITEGLDFPEGPVFAGDDLLFSNCYGMWIGRWTAEGRLDTFADLSGKDFKPNGLCWTSPGYLWVCEFNQGRILKFDASGKVLKVLNNDGESFSRPNDMTLYNGLIYFTDPKSYSKTVWDGCIYMLNPETEEIKLLTGGLAFPNGIAVGPEGENLYVCESALNRITVLSLKNPEEREVLVKLPGGDPDGIEFYDDKTLLVAHFGNGKMYSIDIVTKTVTDSLELPGKRVTNCVISPDKKSLYITETVTNALYKLSIKP
ncbi:MAG: SMP-30/gluconolactonase/LRE family protein [Candidatus Marinimicrobia bacterium]|nr:SMP-30/gluconolactonase/LRE family protein [Candidatus Neomarinimicrobiota bacterium]